MDLVSFNGGFGRLEDDRIVPMGDDLVRYLERGVGKESRSIPRTTPLQAPVARPGKILCIGLNYADHAREARLEAPDVPVVFAKFANSVTGPRTTVVVPPAAANIDYEAELGVVIGTRAKRVEAKDALGYVGGYVCLNDLSSRSLQFATPQWLAGKALDGFLPMGPWLRTADAVPDPQALAVTCTVNGQLRQDSSTKQMIFSVAELVSYLSQFMTLEPGDVIATGTPSGVGMAMEPPSFLHDGDEVAVGIDGLGTLVNRISLNS